MLITAREIAEAKARTQYTNRNPLHEDDDCIRMAYQWLDAQIRLKMPRKHHLALKHCVEHWAERYVSQSDVEVAAAMHGLSGRYPYYNYSAQLVWPSPRRLEGILQARTMKNYRQHDPLRDYNWREMDDGTLVRVKHPPYSLSA
jgi:hypothetical protein